MVLISYFLLKVKRFKHKLLITKDIIDVVKKYPELKILMVLVDSF